MTALGAQRADLEALAAIGRRRALAPPLGADFASNDYLGLAGSGLLAGAVRDALDRGVAVGSGGSRLLRGNSAEHEALEAEAAAFFGSESALFMPTGYTANAALLGTLPQVGDMIFFDELAHASAHEGMRLSRAPSRGFAHNDPQSLDDALARWRGEGGMGQAWIVVESLYSMDGDFAPLADFAEVATRREAMLVIDEAHATGVFGAEGRGLGFALEGAANIITLHTCGKALGCEGALLCGPAVMRDFLINRARGFIFSTAPSPLIAATVRAVLGIVAAADERRAALRERMALAEGLLVPLGAAYHGSPILPLVLGEDALAMAAAGRLQAAGFDVRGIRPPTVPEGTSRLRIVITLNTDAQDIAGLAGALRAAL